MAFSVTPTSGSAPYSFTVSFFDGDRIDGVNYGLQFRASTSVGSCPSMGIGTNNTTAVSSLLSTGGYIMSTPSVPSGSCSVYTVRVIDLSTNQPVSTASVTVNNV